MIPAYENAVKHLKKLPGLGQRSAERIAMHLLVEKPETLDRLIETLTSAARAVKRCPQTGNICEGDLCDIYADTHRNRQVICVVEQVTDLIAIERSGTFKGTYHVLHGKLSPIQGVRPEHLNLTSLKTRLHDDAVSELILALSNDIEGEATCHYIQECVVEKRPVTITRIGFGLPSGGGVTYADSATLKSALEGRRVYS